MKVILKVIGQVRGEFVCNPLDEEESDDRIFAEMGKIPEMKADLESNAPEIANNYVITIERL